MPALILPLAFSALFLVALSYGERGIRTAFVESTILFCLAAVLITESLGAFRMIEPVAVLSAWTLVLVISLSFIHKSRARLKTRLLSACLHASSRIRKVTGLQKSLWCSIGTLTLLLLVQGIVYPSNSTDTLTYHLPRVVSWIAQRSVDHFPSHNYSQVYMPPFAEYLVMNVNILNAGDRYSNTVQWFFLTACAISTSRLTGLHIPRNGGKGTAHLLVVGMPVAVLQSSTAKNDIVVSFFVLTSVFYSYRWLKERRLSEGFWLGASFGLACLTKATAYLYLGPIAVWLAADTLFKAFRQGLGTLLRAVLPILVFFSVMANLYARNFELTGNPLCIDRGIRETGVNEEFSIRIASSNLLKNLGGQMGPYPLNILYDSVLHRMHRLLDIPIRIQGTHFNEMEYRGAPNLPIHDSNVPNSLYTYLLIAALSCMFFRTVSTGEKPSALLITHATFLILQFVLFSAFLKWQPWHTRLFMPLLFLSVPLVCHALNRIRPSETMKVSGLVMVFGTALLTTVFNDARPLYTGSFTAGVSIMDDRFEKYFTDRFRPLYVEMRRIKGIVDSEQLYHIGLISNSSFPEYILFNDAYVREKRPVHLNVKNISGRLNDGRIQVDCIVTNNVSDSTILRDGRVYRNTTPDHARIWIFR